MHPSMQKLQRLLYVMISLFELNPNINKKWKNEIKNKIRNKK